MPQADHRIVYIVCPARYRTGGPEALHQLGRALLDLRHDARMVYFEGEPRHTRDGSALHFPRIEEPTVPAYVPYRVPTAWTIEGDPADAATRGDSALQITDQP